MAFQWSRPMSMRSCHSLWMGGGREQLPQALSSEQQGWNTDTACVSGTDTLKSLSALHSIGDSSLHHGGVTVYSHAHVGTDGAIGHNVIGTTRS